MGGVAQEKHTPCHIWLKNDKNLVIVLSCLIFGRLDQLVVFMVIRICPFRKEGRGCYVTH
jgi:hypothetical protein